MLKSWAWVQMTMKNQWMTYQQLNATEAREGQSDGLLPPHGNGVPDW